MKEKESRGPAGTKRTAPGSMSPPPSTRIWNPAGAPRSCTLSEAVTCFRAQMLSPLSRLMGRNVLLEVVTAVLVHLDACRSSDELDPPEAASTTLGTPTTTASTRIAISIFRMGTSCFPAVESFGQH